MNDDPDLDPPRRSRGSIIRIGLALAVGALVLGSGVYVRYLAPKSVLGGPWKWAMNCRAETPKCMRASVDGDGVCSRPCDLGSDCADGIRCVEIETEERNERGVPIKSGYCFPQSFIDLKRGKRDAGATPTRDSR